MAAGSAVAMIGVPNLRPFQTNSTNSSKSFQCYSDDNEATIMLSLSMLGMTANIIMMFLILINKHLRRWSQGLLFHQGAVDCGRAAILLPLGLSILHCEPIHKCSRVETVFLLLVTVSTINMLTTVLNDSPIFPEEDNDEDLISGPLLMDSPQCVVFGTFMIWFASITINLGPTLLSGGLAARSEMIRNAPSCPLLHGPFRHYILNALWISINVICVSLTFFHLHKLHRDLTKANVEAVRVAGLVTTLVNVTGSSGLKTLPENVETNNVQTQNSRKSSSVRNALEEHSRMRNYLLRMEREGIQKVKMFFIITIAYLIFWGPLFFITLFRPKIINGYEVTLHIAYVHAFVNPVLFLILHRGLRHAAFRFCCGFVYDWIRYLLNTHTISNNENPPSEEVDFVVEVPHANLLVPPPPPSITQISVIAQANSSITNQSPYHHCISQDIHAVHNETESEIWRNSNDYNTTTEINEQVYHISSKTPMYHSRFTADAKIQYSGYNSNSD